MTLCSRLASLFVAPALFAALLSPAAHAAATKTYQVTGPVLAVTDTTITVQKGKEKWELARNKETKGPADVKVGDKVTIEYTMTATGVEVKTAAKGEKPAKDAK
jgi:hypothetical protein